MSHLVGSNLTCYKLFFVCLAALACYSIWLLWLILICGDRNNTIIYINNLYINNSDINNIESECNIDLNGITRFGSFYGIPLYYIKKGNLSNDIKSNAILSIATMCDINRILSAKQVAMNFNGPISISIYTTSLEEEIKNKFVCNKIKKHFKNINNKYDIYISILYPDYSSIYYQNLFITKSNNVFHSNIPFHSKFPTNALRNLAVSQTNTQYVSCLDVDFIYMSNTINLINTHKFNKSQILDKDDKSIWIIPSFEWKYKNHSQISQYLLTKSKLLKFIKLQYIEPFYFEWKHAQICTKYKKWYNVTKNYEINYCDIWYEPYIIIKTEHIKNDKYKWDNSFIGRGSNKAEQISVLAHNCFTFKVMIDMFIIHTYSESHPESDDFQLFFERRYKRKSIKLYCNQKNTNTCFTADVCKQYKKSL